MAKYRIHDRAIDSLAQSPLIRYSLKNLKLDGNKLRYEQPKKRRCISLTDDGWDKCRELIKQNFGLSVSEFMEQLGRGQIDLEDLKKAIVK